MVCFRQINELHPAGGVQADGDTSGAAAAQPVLHDVALRLLFEGARISRQSDGVEGPSSRFKRMAEGVVAAYGATGRG